MAPGAQGAPRRVAHPAHRHAPAARAQHGAPDRHAHAPSVHHLRDRHHGDQTRSGDHRAPLNELCPGAGNSQPIDIAPETPIRTIAPTPSPCSPADLPSFPPSFSPIIDITKLMSPNRLTA